jgi:hypothetical protein
MTPLDGRGVPYSRRFASSSARDPIQFISIRTESIEVVGRRTESLDAAADSVTQAAAMAGGDGARKRRRKVGRAFTALSRSPKTDSRRVRLPALPLHEDSIPFPDN